MVIVLVFALPRAMPGDPLAALVNPDVAPGADGTALAELRAYYGLDRPLLAQFGHYVAGLARGDLGYSISRRVPVTDVIWAHMPWTLLLMGTAIVTATFLSFVLGVAAGWRPRSRWDRALVVSTSALRAIPPFALGSVLLLGLAVLVPAFPLSGGRNPFPGDAAPLARIVDVARHLALPALTLTVSLVASNVLLVRNTVVGTLGADYLMLARAKGASERRVKYRHAARNAMLPFVTVVGLQIGFAIGGAILVESVFAYPGMGTLVLAAVSARDYPLLDGIFLMLALFAMAGNLVVDLLYRWVDPRTAEP